MAGNREESQRFQVDYTPLSFTARWGFIGVTSLAAAGVWWLLQMHEAIAVSLAALLSVGGIVFAASRSSPRSMPLLVSGRHVSFRDRALSREHLQTSLRSWRDARHGTRQGSVLILSTGAQRLRLGGSNVLWPLAPAEPYLGELDGTLPEAEFLRLLGTLGIEAPRTDTLEIQLVVRRSPLRLVLIGALSSLVLAAPWVLLEDWRLQLLLMLGYVALGWFLLVRKPGAQPYLRVTSQRIELFPSAAASQGDPILQVYPAIYEERDSESSTSYATLQLVTANHRISVGAVGLNADHLSHTPRVRTLDYLISDGEWNRLAATINVMSEQAER